MVFSNDRYYLFIFLQKVCYLKLVILSINWSSIGTIKTQPCKTSEHCTNKVYMNIIIISIMVLIKFKQSTDNIVRKILMYNLILWIHLYINCNISSVVLYKYK